MKNVTFPRALLALTDRQLEIVMEAAYPLRPAARSRFLKAVARRLAGEAAIEDSAVSPRTTERSALGQANPNNAACSKR